MIFRSLSALVGATIVIATTLLAVNPVFAAVSSDIAVTRISDNTGSIEKYVGGSFAYVNYDEASDSDVGFSVYGGIMPWGNSGFELGYVDLGEVKDSAGNAFSVSLVNVGVIGRSQRSVTLAMFGRAGVAFWDAELTGGSGGSVSDSGGDLYIGVGAENFLDGGTRVRYAVDYYTVSDFNDSGVDENIFYVSIGFQLGL